MPDAPIIAAHTGGVRYFGLLHVDRQNNHNVNLRKHGWQQAAADPIDIYLRCAVTCAASARTAGLDFAVVTNEPDFLRDRAGQLGLHAPALVAHEFKRELPHGIPFYSAHYKLEVLGEFATGRWGQLSALVDLDTVFLEPLPLPAAAGGKLAVYDISDQIFPAFGPQRVTADLETVAGIGLPQARWFGGEAIAGDAAGFELLSRYIERIWPRYLANIRSLHHIGDEMVVSTALNMMQRDGHDLTDWSKKGLVRRWWSARTLCPQPRLRDVVEGCALLHLPADKEFLASRAALQFDPRQFVAELKKSLRGPLAIQGFADLLMIKRTKPRRYVAQL